MEKYKITSIAIVVIAAIIAALFALTFYLQSKSIEQKLIEQNKLNMQFTKEHIEEYFNYIVTIPKLVSLHSDVIAMNPKAKHYLENIVNEYYEQNLISELYVIKSDFDGKSRPFITVEYETHDKTEEEVHSLEREKEEYQTQVQQIQNFKKDPTLKAQISSQIKLCVDEKGFVYSTPIRDGNKLVGIVSVMVPMKNISNALEQTDNNCRTLLFNEDGGVLLCGIESREFRPWFENQLKNQGFDKFIKKYAQPFELHGSIITLKPLNINDSKEWQLAFWFDNITNLGLENTMFQNLGYFTAAAIFIIGLFAASFYMTHYQQKHLSSDTNVSI